MKYTSFAFSGDGTKINGIAHKLPLSNSKVQEYIKKGNPVLVLGDFKSGRSTVSHVSLVTTCSEGRCYLADSVGLNAPLPLNWKGDIYGVGRK